MVISVCAIRDELSDTFDNPVDRPARQFIQCLDAHLDVFFERVLDPVVADAAQGLHEQHHGRHACPGDLGGVVEGAAGEAVRAGREVQDARLGRVISSGWNRIGSMFQM